MSATPLSAVTSPVILRATAKVNESDFRVSVLLCCPCLPVRFQIYLLN